MISLTGKLVVFLCVFNTHMSTLTKDIELLGCDEHGVECS
jgi:hypothetical protein